MSLQQYIDIGGSTYVPTTVLVNSSGVPYTAGGGSSGGLSDTILTDDSGAQFLARDSGTAITYVTLAGAVYTPSTNIRAVTVNGGATSTLQTTGNASLSTLVANTPAPVNGYSPVVAVDAYQAPVTATWTSAAALNTAQTLATAGYDTVIMTIVPTGTITAGAITFEVYDGYNWLTIKASRTDSYSTDTTFSLAGASTHSWQISAAGYPQVRGRLSTAIVGSGSATIVSIISSAPDVSLVTVGIDPASSLPVGTNNIGSVTTVAGTTNFTASAYNALYATLAAAASTPTTAGWENTFSYPSVSLLLTNTKNCTLTVYTSIDSAGAYQLAPIVFYVAAGAGLEISFPANGNYYEYVVTNTDATSGVFDLNVYYGAIPSSGRLPASLAVSVRENGVTGAVAMTVGTSYTAADGIMINCTVSGNVSMTLYNNTTIIVPVNVGLSILPFSVTSVTTANTTATATYSNLSQG